MKITVTASMAGRYKLEAVKDGIVQRSTGWFNNLITDAGLEALGAMGGSSSAIAYCHCGTGTTAPANTDTTLQAYVAGTVKGTQAVSTQSTSPYYGKSITTYTFATGAATGNISEVGIASTQHSSDTGFFMFSRALVLDGGGSPTTITVLSDERLVVTYELRYYAPVSDVTGTFTISGTSYTVTVRAAAVTDTGFWAAGIGNKVGSSGGTNCYSGALAAVTTVPSGLLGSGVTTAGTYTSSSKVLAFTLVFETGIVGTIASVTYGTDVGEYQVGFSPGIVKLNTQVLTLVVQVAWARKSL